MGADPCAIHGPWLLRRRVELRSPRHVPSLAATGSRATATHGQRGGTPLGSRCGRLRHARRTGDPSRHEIHPDLRRPCAGDCRTPVTRAPPLKSSAAFRLLGTAVPNHVAAAIVDGTARYGIDVRIPGAVTAVLARPPNLRVTLASSNDAAARRSPRVIAVERVGGGVAVVAPDFWSASRGRDTLAPTWHLDEVSGWDSDTIRRRLLEAIEQPPTFVPVDYRSEKLAVSPAVFKATYEVPYQAHGALEPTSAVADVSRDRCDIWMATQNVTHVAESVANALGMPVGDVNVHPELMGGSFGRKYEPDPAIEAAQLSARLGTPVRVIWTREDEMARGPHRPTQVARFAVSLDLSGLPNGIDAHYAGPSYFIHGADDVERIRTKRGGYDSSTMEGVIPFPYPISSLRIAQSWVDFGVSVGSWRSTSHSFNVFFIESLVDELAAARHEDPIDYRLRWLRSDARLPAEVIPDRAFNPPFDLARMTHVIETVRERSSWAAARCAGDALGIAVQFAYRGYFAAVVALRRKDGRLVVSNAWLVADVGQVVNRSGADQQLSGGFLFGLTAAFRSGLTIKSGIVVERNFDAFRLLRIDEIPSIDVLLIDGNNPPGGLGEPGVSLAAPALANALCAATGHRARALPLTLNPATG